MSNKADNQASEPVKEEPVQDFQFSLPTAEDIKQVINSADEAYAKYGDEFGMPLQELREMVLNDFMFQRRMLQMYADPRRDIGKECGHVLPDQLNAFQYRDVYRMNPIANRVVELYPKECWQVVPEIYEVERTNDTGDPEEDGELEDDADTLPMKKPAKPPIVTNIAAAPNSIGAKPPAKPPTDTATDTPDGDTPEEEEAEEVGTPFEERLKVVVKSLSSKEGTSFYESQEEEGNALWDYLKRVDILSGIGQYGVLFFGTDNGNDNLGEPLEFNEDGFPEEKCDLIYLRALDETQAQIVSFDGEKKSRRYGLPEYYNLQITETITGTAAVKQPQSLINTRVHWTRIIHVADNWLSTSSSEVFAPPRLEVVWNNNYDNYKLLAGSAEMYWRGAFPGLSFETHPQLGGKVQIDEKRFRQMVERYETGLQRTMLNKGMTVKSVAPVVVDPSPQIERQLEAICIKLACPKRVFMGSERGELSSNQDITAWWNRCKERNTNYTSPKLIVPFIDRLIHVGVLPAPKQYFIKWRDPSATTDKDKASILLARTQAYSAYISGDVEAMMSHKDYLMREAGYSEDEAEAIANSAATSNMEVDTRIKDANPPDAKPVQFAPDGTPVDSDAQPLGPPMAPKPQPPKGFPIKRGG